jgi:hypothetical protein
VLFGCHEVTNARYLQAAMTDTCLAGHVAAVQWLADVMKLSQADVTRWLLATASARGDLDTVKRLAGELRSTFKSSLQLKSILEQALRLAAYNGQHHVIRWLTSHTTVDVTRRGVISMLEDGEMTPLAGARHAGEYLVAIDWLSRCVYAVPYQLRRMTVCATRHFTTSFCEIEMVG